VADAGREQPIFQLGDEDEHRPVGTIATTWPAPTAQRHGRRMAASGRTSGAPPAPRAARGGARRPDQADTIRLLDEGATEVAAVIRGLTDEELDREATTFIGATSVATFIERASLPPRCTSPDPGHVQPAGQAS